MHIAPPREYGAKAIPPIAAFITYAGLMAPPAGVETLHWLL